MNLKIKSILVALTTATCCSAFAEVTAEEARELGSSLTPWGAEMAGNNDGTIPEYTGSIEAPPASYDPARPGVLTDPFKNEKPLFSIAANNMARYADKLSEGIKTMLTKYPGFRLDVFPTHRTANYPKFVSDNSLVNATQCKQVGTRLVGCIGGVPFPIPKTGEQIMWNHQLSFMGTAWTGRVSTIMVDASGRSHLMGSNEVWFDWPYYSPNNNGKNIEVMQRIRYEYQEPARVSGERILIHYSIDNDKMLAWQYLPGQRRTKLSPDLKYDTPHPQSGGSSTMDNNQGFLGPTDQYNWKIIGKKEMYIPYNNFEFYDAECAADHFTKNYMNPECMRWELHRVWVVEATLKEGKRNIYNRRLLYIDEDTYASGVYDNYDVSGKVYRVGMQASIPSYHDKTLGSSGITAATFDLQTGVYVTDNYPNFGTKARAPTSATLPDREWTPEALAGSGVR